MSNKILIKRGSGTPTTSDLDNYEIAYDTGANKLYIRDGSDIIPFGAIVDEDNFASDDANRVPSQQSVKAYIASELAAAGAGDITAVVAGTGLSGGANSGSATLNIDSTVATLTGSQTLSNKTLASPIFTGDVTFNDASTPQLKIKDTTNNVLLDLRATDTLAAIGTTTDSPLHLKQNGAFQLSINSTQIILNATGEDRDTIIKDDSGTSVFKVDAGTSKTEISTLLLDSVSVSAIQSSGESFANNDTSLMTSAAIEDKILSYGYATQTGDITAVTAGTGLDGGGSSGDVTLSVDVSDFMSNGSNNRIVTATGTDAMNAEANLTFDSSFLELTDSQLRLDNSTFGTYDWEFQQDNDGDLLFKVPSTGGAEVRISADGGSSSWKTTQVLIAGEINLHADGTSYFKQGATPLVLGGTSAYTTGGTPRLSIQGAGLNIGSGTNDMSYMRRIATGEYQWQTWNGANDGELQLQPYGGKVGIGTTSPATNLEVKSTGNTTARISTDGDSGDVATLQLYRNSAAYAQMHYEAGGGANAGFHITDFRDDANSHIIFNTRGDNERMRIEGDGNVGIGTTSPAYKLHLEQAGGVMQQLKATDSAQAYMKFVNSATGDGQFSDGFLFGLDSDETVAIWNYEGTAMRFATAGAEKMRIDSSGNVGIGTASPSAKLDVSGDIRATAGYSSATEHFQLNFAGTSNSLLKIVNSGWSNETTHDILFNYWQSNLGDYTYLKSAGNSTSGHGIALVGDSVFAVGDTTVATGAVTNSATAPFTDTWFTVNGSGNGVFKGSVTSVGASVSGNITVTGTVDGRDVASDGSKLDGIESGATADQTITLTGDVTGSGSGSFATTVVDNSHNHHSITSNTGDPGDSRLQYWQTNSNTTLNPNSNWFTAIRMGHGDPVTYYSNTIAVQMTGTGTGDLYTRNTANGNAGSWFKHWNDGNDGSGSGLDADTVDGQHASAFLTSSSSINATTLDNFDSTRFFRRDGAATATVGAGWMTVATNTSGRRAGEILVTDADSGDHGFIRIHWLRSYADSNFTVINCGGHQNRITGVRVLSQDSDNTYGEKVLQVYVTANSSYDVKIFKMGDDAHYTAHTVHTPTIENTISGYSVHGNSLENLDTYGFAHEEGIYAGGALKAGGVATFSNRVDFTGTDGFTIGNYGGYDRIVNNSNQFRFLTDGDAYANMQFATVTAGTWNGSVIASAYLDADTAHLSGTQTFSGAKTFGTQTWNGHITWNNGININVAGESSFDVSGSGVWQVWDSGTGAPFIMCDVGQRTQIGSAGSRGLLVHGEIEGSSLDISGNADIDGTANLDNTDIDGTLNCSGTATFTARTTFDDSGADGVLFKASDNSSNSSRAFFDGTSTSCIFQEGNDLSFRSGATTGSSSGTERFFINSSGPQVPTGSQLYVDDIHGKSNGTNRLVLDDDTQSGIANGVSLTGVNHIYLCPDETNNGTGEVRVITGTDNDLDSGTADAVAKITNAGEAHFKGDVVAFSSSPSDRQLKENISTIENGLDKVMKLRGVEFDWTATSRKGQHDIGLIAQEVEEVLPEVVSVKTLRVGEFGRDGDEKDFKTVNYEKMVGVLIEAVKEQQKQINKLEEKLNG